LRGLFGNAIIAVRPQAVHRALRHAESIVRPLRIASHMVLAYDFDMTVKLPDDLRTAITHRGDELVTVVDDMTQQLYVILPREEYESLCRSAALYDSSDLSPDEMVATAGMTFSGSDGWDAPGMEDYDE
jgi:hypothetical protein